MSEGGGVSTLLGAVCAFGGSITWAIGSTTYSRLTQHYSPFAVNFTRALVALPLFVLAVFFVSGGLENGLFNYRSATPSHWGWFALSMVASYGLGDVLFVWSARSLGVSGALAIGSSYPIWTVLAGVLFAGEPISFFQVLGLFIIFIGIVMVILNTAHPGDQEGEGLSSKRRFSWKGAALALGTSFAWAVNGFAISRGAVNLIPPVGNTIRMLVALVLTGLMGRALFPKESIVLPAREMARFIWVFILEAFFGSYLYVYGMSHSSLALGSSLSSLAPVISVPVAVFLGWERFSVLRICGVIFAFGGVCLLMQGI